MAAQDYRGTHEEATALIERGLALVNRGKVLDRQWEKKLREGGSGSPLVWAEEAYDHMLDQWAKDARAYYEAAVINAGHHDE
ncbi:MAG: hypothetical protein LDL44_03170 [Caenispirillum sp.]|nr:hypothetical protein [Caenispirillum sp.]